MIIDEVDQRTVRSAIELASRAPSVHNSQPWQWILDGHLLHLNTDRRRWLPATDPDGRDLIVSCGAVLHHLRVALAAADVNTTVHRVPNRAEPDRLATLELRPGPVADADLALAAAIPQRRTDRRPFVDRPVPDGFLRQLEDAALRQGAILRVVPAGSPRFALLDAVREAAGQQQEAPGYATEIAAWTGMRAGDDGVPALNLLRRHAPGVPGRRFPVGDVAPGPDREDGATLVVLGTASDDALSQLRAGEAMSAVLLTATRLGLATCPLSQPLEVGATRLMVRDDVLEGTLSPQLVLRVGRPPAGPPLPATPRRGFADVVTVQDDS